MPRERITKVGVLAGLVLVSGLLLLVSLLSPDPHGVTEGKRESIWLGTYDEEGTVSWEYAGYIELIPSTPPRWRSVPASGSPHTWPSSGEAAWRLRNSVIDQDSFSRHGRRRMYPVHSVRAWHDSP